MDHRKKTDKNQAAIVEEARAHGLRVEPTYAVGEGFPDILVGGNLPCPHCGKTFWQERVVEIKNGKGKLTPSQVAWWWRWKDGDASIAHDWQELEALLGLAGHPDVRELEEVQRTRRQPGASRLGRKETKIHP